MKYTPGPWVADGGVVYADHGLQVHICDTGLFSDQPFENARLIAAAPELLEALKSLKELCAEAIYSAEDGGDVPDRDHQSLVWRLVNAAIAKAEGDEK